MVLSVLSPFHAVVTYSVVKYPRNSGWFLPVPFTALTLRSVSLRLSTGTLLSPLGLLPGCGKRSRHAYYTAFLYCRYVFNHTLIFPQPVCVCHYTTLRYTSLSTENMYTSLIPMRREANDPSPLNRRKLMVEMSLVIPGHTISGSPKAMVVSGAVDRVMDGWYTLPQAEAYLVAGEIVIRKLIRAGRIRAFRPSYRPNVLLVSRADCRQVLNDAATTAGMFSGCVNQSLPQPDNEEKSKPKSKRRGKQI